MTWCAFIRVFTDILRLFFDIGKGLLLNKNKIESRLSLHIQSMVIFSTAMNVEHCLEPLDRNFCNFRVILCIIFELNVLISMLVWSHVVAI